MSVNIAVMEEHQVAFAHREHGFVRRDHVAHAARRIARQCKIFYCVIASPDAYAARLGSSETVLPFAPVSV